MCACGLLPKTDMLGAWAVKRDDHVAVLHEVCFACNSLSRYNSRCQVEMLIYGQLTGLAVTMEYTHQPDWLCLILPG